MYLLFAVRADLQPVTRRQFLDVVEYGAMPGYPVVLDEQRQAMGVYAGIELRVRAQGFEL